VRQLDLTILNSGFIIASSDDSMTDALEQLWEPFLGSNHPPSLRVDVTRTEEGWAVREESKGRRVENTPWKALIEIRNLFVATSLVEAPGVLDLHAAVVVRSGSALLLVGDPYAGKTSLAVELTRQHWSLFSDDVAPIDRGSGRVLPFPKPLGIKLRPWSSYTPYWKRPPRWRPKEDEAFLVPATSLIAKDLRPTAIDYLVVVDFQRGGVAELVGLTVAEATALCGRQLRDVDHHVLRLLAQVCGRAQCGRLTYGSDRQASHLLKAFTAR
jgi:hypothetical protein